MNLTLSEMMSYLLAEKNFFARVANRMNRVPVPGLKTMGVGLRDGRVTLFYDPEFIARATMPFGVFVLEHEILHIVLDHIPRYFEMLALTLDDKDREKAKIVYNQAMDCADNGLLRTSRGFEVAKTESREMAAWANGVPLSEIPPDGGIILPEKLNLPLEGSFELYQYMLMERVQELPELSEAFAKAMKECGMDGHNYWIMSQGDGSGKEISMEELQAMAHRLRGQLKQTLRGAIREQSQQQGLIPGEIAELLQDYLRDPVIPWWELLNSRIHTAKRIKIGRGISRPNRALSAVAEEDKSVIPAIGKTRDATFRVFFYVDTSGSQTTENLSVGLSELTHMLAADEDMQVRYMQGDAETAFDQVFNSGEELPKTVHGRGGTEFNVYFKYMLQYLGSDETAPDIVIVYTDGYASPVLPENRFPYDIPVIWLLTPNHATEAIADYGECIICDPAHLDLRKKG